MSSERAGTPTHGALDREKARDVLARKCPAINDTHGDDVLEALEACVVPDPRIARIEALLDLLDGHDKSGNVTAYGTVNTYALRTILRGDQ